MGAKLVEYTPRMKCSQLGSTCFVGNANDVAVEWWLTEDKRAEETYETTCDLLKFYQRDMQLFIEEQDVAQAAAK